MQFALDLLFRIEFSNNFSNSIFFHRKQKSHDCNENIFVSDGRLSDNSSDRYTVSLHLKRTLSY